MQESVELDHFAGSCEYIFVTAYADCSSCLFQLRICHLGSDGAFPYQVVQFLFLC